MTLSRRTQDADLHLSGDCITDTCRYCIAVAEVEHRAYLNSSKSLDAS